MNRRKIISILIICLMITSYGCSRRENRIEELGNSEFETEIFDANAYKNALKDEELEEVADNKTIEDSTQIEQVSNKEQSSSNLNESLSDGDRDALKEQIINELVKSDTLKGEQGVAGTNGVNGKDGVSGKDGVDGVSGKDGLNGANGKDGKSIVGATGKTGETGTAGTDGKDGYTPVAGVDYYTEAEIEGMKKELVTQLKSDATPKKGIDYYTDDDVNSIIEKVASAFENNNVFSSTATECGTWLDGSKIYTQTFIVPIKKEELSSIPHEIENINTVWIDSQNSFITLSDFSKSYLLGSNEFDISVTASKSLLEVSGTNNTEKELVAYVTLRFVKTK